MNKFLFSLVIFFVTATVTAMNDSNCSQTSAQFSYQELCICNGDTLNLSASLLASKYQWSTGDTTRNIQVTNAGLYVCTYNTSSGIQYDSIEVMDCDAVADFIITNLSLNNFLFNNTSLNGRSYLWTFGDGDSSNLINPTHIYKNQKPYEVCLIVYGDCNIDTICKDILTIGLLDGNHKFNLELFPNPAKDVLFMELDGISGGEFHYKILDISGNEQMFGVFNASTGTIKEEINISGIKSGTYFVIIYSSESALINRILIKE